MPAGWAVRLRQLLGTNRFRKRLSRLPSEAAFAAPGGLTEASPWSARIAVLLTGSPRAATKADVESAGKTSLWGKLKGHIKEAFAPVSAAHAEDAS